MVGKVVNHYIVFCADYIIPYIALISIKPDPQDWRSDLTRKEVA